MGLSRNCSRGEVEMDRRIVVCDYSGHSFQVQLSRELAKRGHRVLHLYSRDFLTPRGLLHRQDEDASGFEIEGLSIGDPHAKDSFIRRRRQEKKFGSLAAERTLVAKPHVVLSCNMPLDAQAEMNAACRRRGIRFLLWLQDLYSVAILNILTRKLGPAGYLIGLYYQSVERAILRRSDSVICISDSFIHTLRAWGVPIEKCVTIPNWAPIDEIPVGTKQNGWAREHGVAGKKVVLYTGTLGLKHNIEFLLAIADRFEGRDDATLVVTSEGSRAERLRAEAIRRSLTNITILPFQPYERYPEVLATADVLLAFIDNDAGVYSVPSKILSYLCAGRPIVLAAPERNLASETVIAACAGVVVPADAPAALVRAVEELIADDQRRIDLGRSARDYAVKRFDIERIADRFEELLLAGRNMAAAAAVADRHALRDSRRAGQRSEGLTESGSGARGQSRMPVRVRPV